jgi:uncharacterized protein YdeI (YjbR/CyaY-like superfamily)
MKKYKISESNLKEFWNLFSKKPTPDKLQTVIDNDPVLKKLQDELDDIDRSYIPKLRKMKQEQPRTFEYLQSIGMIAKDFK